MTSILPQAVLGSTQWGNKMMREKTSVVNESEEKYITNNEFYGMPKTHEDTSRAQGRLRGKSLRFAER